MDYNREEAKQRVSPQVVQAMAIGPGQRTSILEPVPTVEEGFALAGEIQASIHKAFEDMPETSGHHYQVSVSWHRKRACKVVLVVARDKDAKGQGVFIPDTN